LTCYSRTSAAMLRMFVHNDCPEGSSDLPTLRAFENEGANHHSASASVTLCASAHAQRSICDASYLTTSKEIFRHPAILVVKRKMLMSENVHEQLPIRLQP
jgi:hypothetical protein